jgi:membrane protein
VFATRAGAIITRTLRSFYDDQMTRHAAALTDYALMSLFPAVLLALSLLDEWDRRAGGV